MLHALTVFEDVAIIRCIFLLFTQGTFGSAEPEADTSTKIHITEKYIISAAIIYTKKNCQTLLKQTSEQKIF